MAEDWGANDVPVTAFGAGDKPASAQPTEGPTISSVPGPQGIMGKIGRWTDNVTHDLKYGTDLTGVGVLLKKMGAHGLDVGNSPKVGDFMGSLPLGLLRATKGVTEVPSQPMQGARDIVGGAAQAATMPSMVMGPEGGAATEAAGAAVKGASKVAGLIPSAERAGEGFSQVMTAAHDLPINISMPGSVALRTQELAQSGGSMPKVVNDFLKRVTKPDSPPLTYQEAKDFYSNATRVSADEAMRLTPIMKRQVAQFTSALNTSLEQAAEHVGQLDTYQKAMSEYHNAMRLRALGEGAKDALTSTAAKAVGAAGAGAAGAYAVKELLK